MATGAQAKEKVILQVVNDREFEAHAVAGAMVGETIMETNGNDELKSRIENVPSYEQQLKASLSSSSRGSQQQQQQHEKEEDLGMWDSMSRWWSSRKERQKREYLEKQVEEQQKILKNSPYMSIQNENGVEIYSGLKNNSTFQSVTQVGGKTNNNREDVGVSFCQMIGGSGLGECSGSSSSSFSDENVARANNNSLGEGAALVHGEKKRRGKKDRNVNHSYDSDEGEVDGFIKIASRNDTLSGQGIAVQFEIPQTPSHDRDAFAYVSVVEEKNCTIPPLLTIGQMKNLVSLGLPSSLLYSKWKRLYSLQRDGDSFEGAFLPRVRNDARTVLVIKTTCGSIFGGFADSPWKGELGNIYSNTVKDASFYGSAQACLFSCNNNELDKDDVLVYKWTGANRYCQLCDLKNKMIAFGGGGKSGEFGLCVEDDFRVGSTGHCETYDNEPLCETSYFEILDVECWGFVMGIE